MILENFVTVLGLLKEYGDFWRLWTGPELNLIVQDPNDVEVNVNVTKVNHFYDNIYRFKR